jgi:hypothetical protein
MSFFRRAIRGRIRQRGTGLSLAAAQSGLVRLPFLILEHRWTVEAPGVEKSSPWTVSIDVGAEGERGSRRAKRGKIAAGHANYSIPPIIPPIIPLAGRCGFPGGRLRPIGPMWPQLIAITAHRTFQGRYRIGAVSGVDGILPTST